MKKDEILDCVVECTRKRIPFALFSLPGEETLRLFINPSFPEGTGERFIVAPWLSEFNDAFSIYNEVTPAEISIHNESGYDGNTEIPQENTIRESYIEKLSELIVSLKEDGRKTVISRVICGDVNGLDLKKFINLRFSGYPATFRFVYYTPGTGLWVGTSPEELLSFNKNSGRFSISSLAGTKKADSASEWDAKNIVEQSLVSRFISDTLDSFGIKHISKVCNDVAFHPVVHRCHRFFGYLKEDMIPDLLDRLSPTPALCGYPRERAIEDIERIEHFKRGCYGGYIGYENNNTLILYVNLRSIVMSGKRYCIYAGGGITGASEASREWEETSGKAETMLADLSKAMK